ncbi:MAG: nitroreductase family deazaflavin-dependent oxidoreductase [Anaerolineae bacterium]
MEKGEQPKEWQRLLHRFLSLAPVSRFLKYTAHRVDGWVYRLSGGQASVTAMGAGLPVVMLTTVGARTGKSRTAPLVGIPDGDKIVLIASNFGGKNHPAWYFNLCAHPEATVSMNGKTRGYMARPAEGKERERYWQKAVDLYAGYAAYKERAQGREIPVMVLTPKTEE